MVFGGLSTKAATRIWLGVTNIALAIATYEIAAGQGLMGWHTISWLACAHQWLGWLILTGMLRTRPTVPAILTGVQPGRQCA